MNTSIDKFTTNVRLLSTKLHNRYPTFHERFQINGFKARVARWRWRNCTMEDGTLIKRLRKIAGRLPHLWAATPWWETKERDSRLCLTIDGGGRQRRGIEMRHNQLKASEPNSTAARDRGHTRAKAPLTEEINKRQRERERERETEQRNQWRRKQRRSAWGRTSVRARGLGIPRVYGTKLTKWYVYIFGTHTKTIKIKLALFQFLSFDFCNLIFYWKI